MREVDKQFRRLYDRRVGLFTILITSVIIAFLVNTLTLPLETFIEKNTQVLGIPKEAIYVALMFY